MSPEVLEALFAERHVRPKPGRTLIVGSRLYPNRTDRRVHYKNAVGVDLEDGPGVDIVMDLEEPIQNFALGAFTHIECWSVLEHSRRPWLLAANLESLLITGGTIHVQVPFVWRVHNYPGDYWRFTTEAIRLMFPRIKWVTVMYANTRLVEEGKVPIIVKDTHKYLARTEVYAFGRR